MEASSGVSLENRVNCGIYCREGHNTRDGQSRAINVSRPGGDDVQLSTFGGYNACLMAPSDEV
jgi:hypothetical protein